MAGEATKKEHEQGDPNNPGRGPAPEIQQEDPSKQDPNKRNKPDQYNQGGGMPPTEQAAGKQGGQGTQTGHEDPRSGSGQHSENKPQGGQQQGNQGREGNQGNQGNQGGQQGQKGNPQQQGGQRSGQNEGSDRGQQRGEGQQDRGRDSKSTSETDDRGVKQGQQKH